MKKKVRHLVMNRIVRTIMTPILNKKFNLKVEKSELKGPFIVIGNHTTDYDEFFIAKSFKDHVYFVMSDHISSIPVAGKLINFLVQPIPITKSTHDATTVKHIFEMLKSGGVVGIFPEGNKSFSGDMSEMKPTIAKLVKKSQVPLVIYNIEGGYLSSPRWSKEKRKGQVNGKIKVVLQPEEYNKMTNEQLFDFIKENLRVNAYEIQEKQMIEYKGENLADNIESFMYVCPECKSISTLHGDHNLVKCDKCDYHAEFNKYGYLEGGAFSRLDEYDKFQKKHIYSIDFNKYKDNEPITQDEGFMVKIKKDNFKSNKIGTFDFVLYKDRLEMISKDKDVESIIIPVTMITGYGIEGMNGLQLSLSDGRVYRTKNEKPVSALKYTNIISKLNGLQLKF